MQLAKPFVHGDNVGTKPAAQPFRYLSEQLAFEKPNDYAFILFPDSARFKLARQIRFHYVIANAQKISLKNVAIGGIVNVQRRALALGDKELARNPQTLLKRFDRRVLGNNFIYLVGHNLAYKRRYVLKMIVKRIAIYSAICDNILDGNFIERSFVEQLQKRRRYRVFGRIWHTLPLEFAVIIYKSVKRIISIPIFSVNSLPDNLRRRKPQTLAFPRSLCYNSLRKQQSNARAWRNGRRAGLRIRWATVEVQVLSLAPDRNKLNYYVYILHDCFVFVCPI